MASIIDKLLDWWRRLWRRKRLGRIRVVASRNDVPERIGSDVILVGSESAFKWAILECPCRCGDRIEVNLMRSRSPVWTVAVSEKAITFHPSLWREKGTCGSHFIVRNSEIQWV